MADVAIGGVTKRYGDNTVIEGLDLVIHDEEFMVLVGPSGCGKSTLLRMVAGLEEITGGTIAIGDRVVNDLHPKDRDIAMVFQNYALYPHMSVRQNLEFGLKMRRTPKAERARLIIETAEILGLGSLLDRKPRELSGGQRQRVAVGRAIVRQPAVFLFDEPLSNLDAKLRVQMRAELTKLQQRLRTTTIYVTHDQTEAMTMGDRIAVMNEGQIMQVGAPMELYAEPANLFVANFIGTPPMNFIGCTITADGDLEAGALRLPGHRQLRGIGEGRRITVGVRPERVRERKDIVHLADQANGTLGVSVRVEMVETLGHEVVVHGRLGDDMLVTKLEPSRIPEVGSELNLDLDPDDFHYFDTESGRRLNASS